MIIVIDGYNVLKQIFPGVKGTFEKQRNQFIRQLGYYKHKKAKDIKEIIVVFDAGQFCHATREVKHGIVVVYSGQASNADSWIVDFTERKKGEEILIITMDRKLIDLCGKNGASALGSLEFCALLNNILLEDAQMLFTPLPETENSLEIYAPVELDDSSSSSIKIDRKALDLLMEQESLYIRKDVFKEDTRSGKERKGRGATLSKEEKMAYNKLKKLY